MTGDFQEAGKKFNLRKLLVIDDSVRDYSQPTLSEHFANDSGVTMRPERRMAGRSPASRGKHGARLRLPGTNPLGEGLAVPDGSMQQSGSGSRPVRASAVPEAGGRAD